MEVRMCPGRASSASHQRFAGLGGKEDMVRAGYVTLIDR